MRTSGDKRPLDGGVGPCSRTWCNNSSANTGPSFSEVNPLAQGWTKVERDVRSRAVMLSFCFQSGLRFEE